MQSKDGLSGQCYIQVGQAGTPDEYVSIKSRRKRAHFPFLRLGIADKIQGLTGNKYLHPAVGVRLVTARNINCRTHAFAFDT